MNMKFNITRVFQGITLTSFGFGVANFIKSRNSKFYTDKLNDLARELKILSVERDIAQEALKVNQSNEQLKILNEINDKLDKLNNNLIEFKQKITLYSEENFDASANNLITHTKSVREQAKEAWDKCDKNSIFDFDRLMDQINDYYSKLGYYDLLAAVNLTGCMVLLISIISIIIVLYSDSIINKYKINERYPILKNIIELRRQFQKYYLIWDLSVILIVIITMIIINVLFLTT